MDNILRLQTSLVIFISNGTAKTKLGILPFLYCGEFVKNSSGKPDVANSHGIEVLRGESGCGKSGYDVVTQVYISSCQTIECISCQHLRTWIVTDG